MTRSWAIAAIWTIAFALPGTVVRAEGLPPPTPVETWTGFSVGVGGGAAFLNADVNTKAVRVDELGRCFSRTAPEPDEAIATGRCDLSSPFGSELPFGFGPTGPFIEVNQHNQYLDNLRDTSGLFTVQGNYDYQFAPRWLAGIFLDADWSNLSAHEKRTYGFSQTLEALDPQCGGCDRGPLEVNSDTTIDALIRSNWTISLGGRVGWLAMPRTLLYVLAAYTHADLDDAQVEVNITDPMQNADLRFLVGGVPFQPQPFSHRTTSLLVKLPELAGWIYPWRWRGSETRRPVDLENRISMDSPPREFGTGRK